MDTSLGDILRTVVLLCVVVTGAGRVSAQTPGSADSAWQIERQSLSDPPSGWLDIATQPNGRMLVAGNNLDFEYVRRFLDNGQSDPGFGESGVARIPPVGFSRLFVDGLGRIYVHEFRAASSARLIRLQANGAVDTSFNNGTVARVADGILDLAVQPDGRILTVTQGREGGAEMQTLVIATRLLPNGSADSSFGTNGMLVLARTTAAVSGTNVEVLPDGSFIVAFTESAASGSVAHLRKWTAAGVSDTGFGNNGAIRAEGFALGRIVLQPDGMVLVPGTRSSDPSQPVIARLTANGWLDANFGNAGFASPGVAQITQVAVEPGGGILVGGADPARVVRLTPAGAVDSSFASAPIDDEAVSGLAIGNGVYLLTRTTIPGTNNSQVRALRKLVPQPAPRSGSLSTGGTPSGSGFRVDARDLRGIVVDRARMANAIGLHGYVYPQGTDVGATADLFVVVATSRGFYMRNTSGAFVPWNGQVASLVPAHEDVQLISSLYVPVYSGQLPFADTYGVYLGYMRSDGGPLVYIDEPGTLAISE